MDCCTTSLSSSMRAYPFILAFLWAIAVTAIAQSATPRLAIKGLEQFEEKVALELLKDQWAEIEKKGLTPSRANDAAYFLRIGLRQDGFTEAEVGAAILAGNVLELRVTEGTPLLLGEIVFNGVEGLDEALLRESMVAEMKKRRSLLKSEGDLPFVRSAIEGGVKAIQGYARYEGFHQATATLRSIDPPDEKRRVNVTVDVFEGPQFLIESVTIQGASDAIFRKLRKVGDPYLKKPVNVANTRALQGECLRILSELGYFDAVVSLVKGMPEASLTDTKVEVVIEVAAGDLYVVKHIEVEGSKSLPDQFVEKRFIPLMGERYDPTEMRQVYRTLIQTGLYENLEMTPRPSGDGEITIDVKVEEAGFRQLGLYGGFGSFDGYILGTGYTNRNLFGTGRSLRSDLEVNGRGVQGELNYLDRWFLDSEWQFGVKVFTGTRELEGYSKWELGASASLSYATSEHTSISFYGSFTHVSLTDERFVDVEIGPGDYQVQEFGTVFTWDHRNDLEPTGHGYLFEVSLDYATAFLVGDVSMLKSEMRLAHYWKMPWDTELRLGARAGIMHPLGDSKVIPVDLRFFSGGSQTIRSFPERELGPQDSRRNPIGGQFYTMFNAEYSIPIQDAFSLAVFFDAGNLLPEAGDYGFSRMHYAGGLGLRYELPIGPLRVDYGYNLNREEGEPQGALHIGFGFAF